MALFPPWSSVHGGQGSGRPTVSIQNLYEFEKTFPRNRLHVSKEYYVEIDKDLTDEIVTSFRDGVILNDGECKSSELKIIDKRSCYVTLTEGRYHRIKRMFGCFSAKVIELERISMGNLILPNDLNQGECRELTEEELNFRNILNNLVPNKNTPEQSVIDLSGINVIDLKNETNVKIVEQNINETNNKPLLDDNSTEQQANSNAESDQERNFRKVLGDLIKPITKKKEQPEENLQAIKPIETEDTKKDLSIKTETTDNNQPSSVKYSLKQKSHFSSRNTTSIDYTDLRLMASQDGLKLRISSKTSSRSIGTLFINKLRLITSLSMFLISLIQLLVITIVYKTILQLSPGIIFAIVAIFAILPLIFLTKYLRKPTKTISKVIHKDSILTTAILVFNLILINFACIMLINLDFTILKNIVVYAIIPAILYIDILLCSIIRYFMANSLICKIPNKKTAV